MATHQCGHCGAHFRATRSTAKFCSDRCRVRSHRGQARPMPAVWLRRSAHALVAHIFRPVGVDVPVDRIDIAFGFPMYHQKLRIHNGRAAIAAGLAIGDQAIVIPPVSDPVNVLAVLAHELIHTIALDDGHKGSFAKIAKAIGLLPPLTTLQVSGELRNRLMAVVDEVGPMPLPYDTTPQAPVPAYQQTRAGGFRAVEPPDPWRPDRKTRKPRGAC